MSSIDTRQKLIYGDGALQKASLTYKNAQTGREVTLPVQFNPTEYSISRGLCFFFFVCFVEFESQPDSGYLYLYARVSGAKGPEQISE